MALGSVSEPFALNTTSTEGPTFDQPAEPVLETSSTDTVEGSESSDPIYQDLLDEQDPEDDGPTEQY